MICLFNLIELMKTRISNHQYKKIFALEKLRDKFKYNFLELCVIFIGFLALNTAQAETSSSNFIHLLDAIHSMQANFTQIVYDNRGKAVERSYGKMALERPGKFRWEVKKPIPQLIIANQSRLWVYDPDLQQVTIKSLSGGAGETPGLLLSHDNISIDKVYNIKQITKKSSSLNWFELVPRSQDNMFASVQMGFAKDQIEEMHLQDHLGHITSIRFANAKINKPLSAKVFVFKSSTNIDVIDETRKK